MRNEILAVCEVRQTADDLSRLALCCGTIAETTLKDTDNKSQ
jgi:hypothetical protein